jgi:uracil-DNA glycosylase
LDQTPFDKVKVVILGQDPYHGPGQANGLCFSVNKEIPLPPSLKNIFKELHADIGINIPKYGDLSAWAEQGVLLLNSVLTVRANQPASHQNKGWENFTDTIIRTLSQKKEHLIFILWGSFAKSKKSLIDSNLHCILEAAHPSPFSAHSGFFGCNHFSKANAYLKENNKVPIDWNLNS